MHEPSEISVVVMAKAGAPGAVKTRLVGDRLGPEQAYEVHKAMLSCVLRRLTAHIHGPVRRVVAVAAREGGPPRDALLTSVDASAIIEPWAIMPQGAGDLGDRLIRVWDAIGGGAVIFFGVDSPDVPAPSLMSACQAVLAHDVVLGPVPDGGYWTIAGRRLDPRLLAGIDWGTERVYDQTRDAAARLGWDTYDLPPWYDVDFPDDLDALRARLADTNEPALCRLRARLDEICSPPAARAQCAD